MNIEQLRGYIKNYPYSVTFYIDDEFITAAYHPIGKQMIEDKIFNLKWSKMSWTDSGGELKVECWQLKPHEALIGMNGYFSVPKDVMDDILTKYNGTTEYFGKSQIKPLHHISPRIDRKETYSRRVSGGTLYEFSKSYHILEHKNRNIYHTECDFCELDQCEKKEQSLTFKWSDLF